LTSQLGGTILAASIFSSAAQEPNFIKAYTLQQAPAFSSAQVITPGGVK
jgi:hypothetical protein